MLRVIVRQLRSVSTKQREFEQLYRDVQPPDLKNLNSRWEKLSSEGQLDVIDYLNDKQQLPWSLLSKDDKSALHYISYGQWGARDSQQVNVPEVVLRGFASAVLFGVVGVGIYNYRRDQEVVQGLCL